MKWVWKGISWIVGLVLFCALCACAETNVSVVSSFARPGEPVSRDCQAQATILARAIAAYPHPESWRWVMLCDDAAWQHFLRHVDRADLRVYALTDIEGQVTCFRGFTLLHPDDPSAQPNHVVAHELAHIRLHTSDEDRAEALAQSWLVEGCKTCTGAVRRAATNEP